MSELWTSVENFIKVLGPFAGVYFAAKVIISYQKDLLGSLTAANTDLRDQIHEQDTRIDQLEGVIRTMQRDQLDCDRRNYLLVAAVRNAGIVVPEVPETHREPPT